MYIHLGLLIILILINLIPDRVLDRKKIILPFSFLVVLVYWSIRYDYGLDYWNYYDLFYSGRSSFDKGTTEYLFFNFMNIWDYYYQFIIVDSVLIVITLYHIVRKYVSPNYYWLFFFFLFAVPSFHFVLISAMRSSIAACILYWAYDLFYISKKRWLPYYVMVIFASLFHTSALAFLILPIIHFALSRMSGNMIFLIFILLDFIQVTDSSTIFSWIVSLSDLTESYNHYSDIVRGSNFNGLVFRSLVLFPSYYICKNFSTVRVNRASRGIFILAFFFLIIEMIGLDFQGRFTVYLYPFFIFALFCTVPQLSREQKLIALTPYFVYIIYNLFDYYQVLLMNINGVWSRGNYYYYHTIFDAPTLP